MSLGSKIAKLRKQKNLKQVELAKLLDIGHRQLVRWENDQSRPRPLALENLAKILGASIDDLTVEPAELKSIDQLPDQELRSLLAYLPEFNEQKIGALKVLLRDMVTSHKITQHLAIGA